MEFEKPPAIFSRQEQLKTFETAIIGALLAFLLQSINPPSLKDAPPVFHFAKCDSNGNLIISPKPSATYEICVVNSAGEVVGKDVTVTPTARP